MKTKKEIKRKCQYCGKRDETVNAKGTVCDAKAKPHCYKCCTR